MIIPMHHDIGNGPRVSVSTYLFGYQENFHDCTTADSLVKTYNGRVKILEIYPKSEENSHIFVHLQTFRAVTLSRTAMFCL